MDLLATVRKEGSRGGRGDFKWSDVEGSSHRENYLGHSLMAPVGRWQKGRDLGWYAKETSATDSQGDPAIEAARHRKEEIRRVKEAEQEALARALGLPVAPKNESDSNMVEANGVERVLKESARDENGENAKGIGYGVLGSLSNTTRGTQPDPAERLEGNAEEQDKQLYFALKEYERRHHTRHRSRSRSQDRVRDRHHHRRRSRDREPRLKRRSRSRERLSRRWSRSRSRSQSKSQGADRFRGERRMERSRSPFRQHKDRRERERAAERR